MDKPLQIRPLTREAGPAWLSLVNSSLQDCPGFEPLIDLDYLRLWGGDRARAGLVLGADCDGQVLGAISLTFGRRRGRLRDLVVRRHVWRRGIGTALVEAAVDRFRERDLSLIEAQDWDVPPYRAFYAALGFHPVRRYLLLRWDLARQLPTLPLNQVVAVRPATGADLEEMADLYARMYPVFRTPRNPIWRWFDHHMWGYAARSNHAVWRSKRLFPPYVGYSSWFLIICGQITSPGCEKQDVQSLLGLVA